MVKKVEDSGDGGKQAPASLASVPRGAETATLRWLREEKLADDARESEAYESTPHHWELDAIARQLRELKARGERDSVRTAGQLLEAVSEALEEMLRGDSSVALDAHWRLGDATDVFCSVPTFARTGRHGTGVSIAWAMTWLRAIELASGLVCARDPRGQLPPDRVFRVATLEMKRGSGLLGNFEEPLRIVDGDAFAGALRTAVHELKNSRGSKRDAIAAALAAPREFAPQWPALDTFARELRAKGTRARPLEAARLARHIARLAAPTPIERKLRAAPRPLPRPRPRDGAQ